MKAVCVPFTGYSYVVVNDELYDKAKAGIVNITQKLSDDTAIFIKIDDPRTYELSMYKGLSNVKYAFLNIGYSCSPYDIIKNMTLEETECYLYLNGYERMRDD